MSDIDAKLPAGPRASPAAAAGVHSNTAPLVLDERRRMIVAGIIVLGSISSILSSTTVNVAIPTLQRVFQAGLTDVQWVLTAYLLGLSAVIPMSGYLSDRFGAKRVYLATLTSFMIASVFCGIAWNISSEIAFRVIQGLAGGMVMPVGMAMLMRMTPPQERGRMMGTLGVPMLLAPAVGPALGGLLIEYFDWRWLFWVNIPACALAIALGIRGLRDSETRTARKLDVVGLLLATPGVVAIIYGLTRASSSGWGSSAALRSIGAGLLLIAAFAGWELTQKNPLLDMRIFRDAAFAASTIVNVISAAALFGAVFVVPVFLQQVQGYGTLSAGLIIGAQGLCAAVVMPVSGWLTDRYGARIVVFVGAGALTIASVLMTTISPSTSTGQWILLLGLRGFAMGFVMMPNASAAYVTLTPSDIGLATAISNTLQRIASSLGIAILASAATVQIAVHVSAPHHTAIKAATAAGFVDTLWLSVGVSILALPAALLLRRPLLGLPHGIAHPPLAPNLRRLAMAIGVIAIASSALAVTRAFY